MFYNELQFTDTETAELHRIYTVLQNRLEDGERPLPSFLADLSALLRKSLENQQNLRPFWNSLHLNAGQHLHLHLTSNDKKVLNLPWQLAFEEPYSEFVYISKGTDCSGNLPAYIPPAGPLKILIMIASPEELSFERRLSYEAEEEAILQALSPLWESRQLQVDFTTDGSLQSLEHQLAQQHYHILYFSGHGQYTNHTGYLVLENDLTSEKVLVHAELLAQTLLKFPNHLPPLVVLASCQTGEGRTEPGLRGVADELIHHGIPSVIAMAFSISDRFATVFTASLMAQLALKVPLVQAYNHAIRNMRREEAAWLHELRQLSSPAQWMIPQLYLSHAVDNISDCRSQSVATILPAVNNPFQLTDTDKQALFIGRRRECARFFSRLLQGEPLLITGQGGVGKTTLARHFVKRLLSHNSLYHCFFFDETTIGIPAMINQLLTLLESAYGLPDIRKRCDHIEKAEDQLTFLLGIVVEKGCKPVWVFDNLENCQEGIGGPVKEIYAGWLDYVQRYLSGGQHPIIFTGRYPIPELATVAVCNLNQVSFTDFYRKCMDLCLWEMSGTGLSMTSVARILHDTLGGSYRALELFHGIYQAQPERINSLLKRLQAAQTVGSLYPEKEIIGELSTEVLNELAHHSKRLLLDELLHVLNDMELQALSLMINFKRPVLPLALEMQLKGDYIAVLNKLSNLTLAEEHIDMLKTKDSQATLCWYYVPPLVKEWLDSTQLPSIEFSHEAAALYYMHVDKNINKLNNQDLEEAFRHFLISGNLERVNSTGAVICNYYVDHFLYRQALHYAKLAEKAVGKALHPEILISLGVLCSVSSNFDTSILYYERSLAQYEALDNREGIGIVLNNIAMVYQTQGKYEDAIRNLEKSLAIRQSFIDQREKGVILNNMGLVFMAWGENQKALSFFQEALELCEADQHHVAIATIYGNIGLIKFNMGAYQEAESLLQQCLERRKLLHDYKGMAEAFTYMSQLYEARTQYEEAQTALFKALNLHSEVDNQQGIGAALNNIGLISIKQANYPLALDYFARSLEIASAIGDLPQKLLTLNNIGVAHLHLSNYALAKENFQESLTLGQMIGNVPIEANYYLNMSEVYSKEGNPIQALQCLQQSLKLTRQLSDRRRESAILNNMSQIYETIGDLYNAKECLDQSLTICIELHLRNEEAAVYNSIGSLLLNEGNTDEALKTFIKSAAIGREIGDIDGQCSALNNIAQAYQTLGDYEQAAIYMRQSLDIAEATNDRSGQATALNNIGQLYNDIDMPDKALEYLLQGLIISQDINNLSLTGTITGNISFSYRSLGQYEQARSYGEQSLKIRKQTSDLEAQAIALHNLAAITLKQGGSLAAFYDTACEAYEIFVKLNHAQGIYYVGQDLANYLCLHKEPADIAGGLALLQTCYDIGVKAGYSDVSEVADLITQYTHK